MYKIDITEHCGGARMLYGAGVSKVLSPPYIVPAYMYRWLNSHIPITKPVWKFTHVNERIFIEFKNLTDATQFKLVCF